MPPSTSTIVAQSSRVARSPRNQAPSSAIHTGAEYWIRIALAAVVSLLARMNRPVVAASAPAAAHSAREIPRSDGRLTSHNVAPAIALRADQIASGCQSTSLISTPPVLQNSPHSTSSSRARW
jgi:hypothetical protein